MAVSLRKHDSYRVVIIHDSGHREVQQRGMTLAAATQLAADIEAQPHTTAYDVRVEEE